MYPQKHKEYTYLKPPYYFRHADKINLHFGSEQILQPKWEVILSACFNKYVFFSSLFLLLNLPLKSQTLTFDPIAIEKEQSQKYLVDVQRITPKDGLQNLLTWTVHKDREGFVWVASKYGLSRYNGYTVDLYTREKNGLFSNNHIRHIQEDAQGNLWLFYALDKITTYEKQNLKAIDIFDPKSGKATSLKDYFGGKLPFKIEELYLPRIADSPKHIWLATRQGEIFLYEQDRFIKVFEQKGIAISNIVLENDSQISVSFDKTLLHINFSGHILERFSFSDRIHQIWLETNSTLWITTHSGDLRRGEVKFWAKNSVEKEWKTFHFYQGDILLDLSHLGYEALFIHKSQKGYWFISFWSSSLQERRLYIFDALGNQMFDYYHVLDKNKHLGKIHDVYESEDYIWLATSLGILKTKVSLNPFQLIHRQEKISNCRGITEDEKGNIYFLNHTIFKWNPQEQELINIPRTTGSYTLIYEDSTLWASTYGGQYLGFNVDLRKQEITRFTNHKNRTPTFCSLKRAANYLIGRNDGLSWLNIHNGEVIPFCQYNEFEQLKFSSVYDLYDDSQYIWIATENGIFVLKEGIGIIRHFSTHTLDLPFDHIRHIHEDNDTQGVFWLATAGGGIIRWKPSFDENTPSTFQQFTTTNGLSHNYTYATYEDEWGKLWVSSDRGLMQIDKHSFEVTTYLTEEGLPHNEFNLTSHYQAKDGTLYFGGLGGLISFHPNNLNRQTVNDAPLIFTDYYLLEEGQEKMNNRTHLIQQANEILIKPADKLFELHFSLLDFANVDKHLYAYKIEGYSTAWQNIKENYIRITHLPYGDYTLRIKGKNINYGWSSKELALKIHVKKPFYLETWFLISISLLVVILSIVAIRWRIYSLKQEKFLLEQEVEKRTQTIQQQAEELKSLDKAKTRFFSNITHEFRTPLTLIIGPLEQVIQEKNIPNIFKRRLNGVLKNSYLLLNLINQLLDLSKIESKQMKIEVTRGDIIIYTRELIKRFELLARKKDLRLTFISDLDNWKTHFDKSKWDQIVYNLLSNAIKFTPVGGGVQVNVLRLQKNNRSYIRLYVRDTGVGIEKEQLSKIFNRFYQVDGSSKRMQGGTGIGLALVKELVEIQEGDIRVFSEIDRGTTFEIHLPVLAINQEQSLAYKTSSELIPPVLAETDTLPVSSVPTSPKEKLELLIIEDNEEMRDYIRYCIDTSKYNITEAINGQEGIEKAFALVPDLIISDVMMPKKNGFEVTSTIRNHLSTSHIPLILLTAKASLESRLEGLQRGADAYLTKPFSPKELTLRIQKLIEIRQSLRQRYENGIQAIILDSYQQEDKFIIELKTYILQHLDEPHLNGEQIAQYFGMSRMHLHRKLKALTNQSISVFVKKIRLGEAFKLLKERKYNISEIAYQTGFSSPSHFSREFKKMYGKAPSEFKIPS